MLPQVNIVRALAILTVLIGHATAQATIDMTDSSYYWVYQFSTKFFKYGTRTFIFLSGFVLFYTYYDRVLTKLLLVSFYKKRFVYVVLPYLLVSLFYFCCHSAVGIHKHESFIEACSQFISLLFSARQVQYHLYFIIITLQFYTLFPFFLSLFQRYVRLAKWAAIIGICFHTLFTFMHAYQIMIIPYRANIFVTYFSQFMLGAWLGIFFPKLKGWFDGEVHERSRKLHTMVRGVVWFVFLMFSYIRVHMEYHISLYKVTYPLLWMEFVVNVQALVAAFVLLRISFMLYKSAYPFIIKMFYRLGLHSFTIYLIHPFFQDIYGVSIPKPVSSILIHVWYFVEFLFILFGTWFFVEVVALLLASCRHRWRIHRCPSSQ